MSAVAAVGAVVESIADAYETRRGLEFSDAQLRQVRRDVESGYTLEDYAGGMVRASREAGGHFTFGALMSAAMDAFNARKLAEFAKKGAVENTRQRVEDERQRAAGGLPSVYGYTGRRALAITNIRMALAKTREKLDEVVPEIETAIEQGRYVADEARTLYAAHVRLMKQGAPVACWECNPGEGQYVERNGVRKFESTYRPCTHNRAARAWAEMETVHGATK